MTTLTAAERALVEEHLPLVAQVVGRVAAHYPRHADREELSQAARLGLVEAAARYEPDRGVPFALWASLRIRGAILDAVRALDFAPRNLRTAEREAAEAREALGLELGRPPTREELAEALGLTTQQLRRLESRVHRALLLSLDAPVGLEDGQPLTLGSRLEDGHLQPLEALEERERARYVRDALACLPPRLQEVVLASYVDEESYSAIAGRLQVTESRVSQLRTEALTLMREAIAAQYGAPVPVDPSPRGRRRGAYVARVAGSSTYTTRLTRIPGQRQPAHDAVGARHVG
jgi:RNA polymerase sigma factor for flagellar operon FliA